MVFSVAEASEFSSSASDGYAEGYAEDMGVVKVLLTMGTMVTPLRFVLFIILKSMIVVNISNLVW